MNVALLDASGDERVRRAADQYENLFAYRRHGPDKGQSDAIAEGWAQTDGDVLGWLNADDILFPGALEKARAALSAPSEPDVVYGHSAIIDDHKRMQGYHWAVERPGPRILASGVISQPSCFFRRSAYEKTVGLRRELHYTMDWDLWIQLYQTGATFEFIEHPLSLVMWAPGTKTSSFDRARRQELGRIIAENAKPGAGLKTMRSFAIHNAIDRIRPAPLKRRVMRLLIRGRYEVFGLSGDGCIKSRAHLYLTHYDKTPKRAVRLRLSDVEKIAAVTFDGQPAQIVQHDEHVMDVICPAPAKAAGLFDLALVPHSDTTPYFVAAEWVAPSTNERANYG